MTTTPHGQVPATQRYKIGYHSDEWGVRSSTPGGIYDDAGPWVRYEDHAAEFRRLLTYCQELESQVIRDCMSTQQGEADGFFLLLPKRPKPEAPAGTAGLDWDAYSGAQMLAFGRDCSDAAIAALRTEQPAPADRIDLHKALTDPDNQPNQYGVEFGMSGQQMHFKIGNQLFRLAYEPDDQQEFEFMKRMLISAFSTFTPDVKAAPQQEAQEPVAWESTTPGYIKYITQARYEKFSPAVRRWYKPYRCSGCAERGAGFDACDIATAAAQGFRDGQSTTKQEE